MIYGGRGWAWVGVGGRVGVWAFWMLGLALILTNAFNLPDVLWTNRGLTLQRVRLGPAWAVLGWLIFSISFIITISNANKEARQQLFHNRVNY